jgi:hypothetical protein
MYIKLTKQKIDNLIQFCKYNFDSDSTNHANGIIILNKTSHIKQMLVDYQIMGIQDYVIHHKNDHKLDFMKMINNKDPYYHMIISFEYDNKLHKYNNFDSCPSIYQFIKICVYSIYRKVFNHLYINSYGIKYIISLKKNFMFELLEIKKKNKFKMKDMVSKLFSLISNKYYQDTKTNNYLLSDKIYDYFDIAKFDKDINIVYKYFNII